MLGISAKREDTKRSFLEESAWLRFSSPLFSALSGACAEDPDLIELGTSARAGQSAGMLLPMAAQYSLLKSSEPRLAHYFPSMTDIPGSPQQAFPAFREFCLDRRGDRSAARAAYGEHESRGAIELDSGGTGTR